MEVVKKILLTIVQGSLWLVSSIFRLFRWWWGKLQNKNNTISALWAIGGLVTILGFCCMSSLILVGILPDSQTASDTVSDTTTVTETFSRNIQIETDAAEIDDDASDSVAQSEDSELQAPTQEPSATAEPTLTPMPTASVTPQPTRTSRPTQTSQPTQTPRLLVSVISSSVNVREGPGTTFNILDTLSEGDTAVVIGRTQDGSWYNIRLNNGTRAWIAASVVETVNFASPDQIRVAITIPAPPVAIAPTNTQAPVQPTSTTLPQATNTPPPAVPGPVIIIAVNKVAEYVDIQNTGTAEVNLTGWTLVSEKGSQACSLGGILGGGQVLRIWALAADSDKGGFNCGFGSNIWNNSEPDPAVLYDASGVEVSRR